RAAGRGGMVPMGPEATERPPRGHPSPPADRDELRHAEQERLFMAESGLAEVRPEASIRFSEAVGYRRLLETMQVHGYELILDAERPLTRGEVAGHWYSNVYVPTVELVAGSKLAGECRHATDSHRFLWLWERRDGVDLRVPD